ncbi:MAG TPA: 1-hydroxycarotenoid 3,4-desaturase CrtD [Flavobacteriales bacterium]|nr:1-hydroxycarotenoid 3,4-desaturase CrtD [Flavobacteriales bacterium]
MKKTAVIGTGIAGLATAARLAAKGHKVTCFEANSTYGGKLTAFIKNGYRFDAGPSLFTMPALVDQVFTACQKDARTYFNYRKKEVACHYFFEDGTFIKAYSDPQKLAIELHAKTGISTQKTEAYFKKAANKYNRVGHIFMNKSLHKAKTWFSADVAKALLFLPSYNLFTSMNRVNEKLLDNQKTIQYFNRYATYNGSNPYAVPGLLAMIPHLEHGIGTFLPEGGMQSISDSIYKLCVELGVEFHFNTPVTEIVTDEAKVCGLVANDRAWSFNTVVCNMDVAHAYKKLLPQVKTPKKIEQQERSSSALIFYWGINKQFPELDLHNILFSNNYPEEFNHIFKKQSIYNDPTVYINITSKEIPSDAPPGCENWFVMINVPANKGYFTQEIKIQARQYILAKLSRHFKTDFEKFIILEESLDPNSIESKTSSLHGSLYGTSSNSRMAAFNRHANFTSKIKNLYFCGGSVHPGGGIPLCLNSAKIVSELVK